MSQQCIPKLELAEFVLGKLDHQRSESVATHIDDCPSCQDTIVSLSEQSDTFVAGMKLANATGDDPYQRENAVRAGLRRIVSSIRNTSESVLRSSLPQDDRTQIHQIGPYELINRLGIGGMGAVFKAKHTKLKREVALKVLPRDRWPSPDVVARFEREMEAIGQLDHPNIVRASDAGEEDGMHYLVMEYVDGLDLSRLVRRVGSLAAPDACELIRQAAIGLQSAHDNRLIHRDIKPSNLILGWQQSSGAILNAKPTLKILDLGLALLGEEHLHNQHELTTVGQLMGTLDYMSPEQGLDSHDVDSRTDIFSLGATLFKLLTGKAPLEAISVTTPLRKLTSLATKQLPSIATLRDDLPTELVAVIDKMLSRDPEARFSTAGEVAGVLEPFCKKANLAALLRRGLAAEDNEHAVGIATALSNSPKTAAASDNGISRFRRWTVCGLVAAAIVFGAFIINLEMGKGQLHIDAKVADVDIEIRRGDRVVETIEVSKVGTTKSTRIRAGEYEIVLKNAGSDIRLSDDRVTISRGKTPTVVVERTSSKSVAQNQGKSLPDKPSASSGKPYTLDSGDVLAVYIEGVLGDKDNIPPVHLPGGDLPPSAGFPIPVRDDGTVRLPLVKPISVRGLTISDVERRIRDAYVGDILKEACFITVSLASTRESRSRSDEIKYDGRTFDQWLAELKVERKAERMLDAVKALHRLHDDDESDAAITQMLNAMRVYGSLVEDSSPEGKLMVAVRESLNDMPTDKVYEAILSEIEQGSSHSREFLGWYFVAPLSGYQSPVAEYISQHPERLGAALVKVANSPLPSTRAWAVQTLTSLCFMSPDFAAENDVVLSKLREAAKSKQLDKLGIGAKPLSITALQVLVKHQADGEIVDLLIDHTRDNLPYNRMWAIQAMRELGPTAAPAIPRLVKLLQLEFDANYPFMAGMIGGGMVAGGMGGGGMGGGFSSGAYYGGSGPSSSPIYHQTMPDVRIEIVKTLVAMGDKAKPAIPRLLKVLEKETRFGAHGRGGGFGSPNQNGGVVRMSVDSNLNDSPSEQMASDFMNQCFKVIMNCKAKSAVPLLEKFQAAPYKQLVPWQSAARETLQSLDPNWQESDSSDRPESGRSETEPFDGGPFEAESADESDFGLEE